jgi:alkylation response protein AidB-like acyl-CoA dehydrogenase
VTAKSLEYGGDGLNYAQAAQITRRIARGDTGIAHLIGYHFAQTRIAPLFGTPEQADALRFRRQSRRLPPGRGGLG